MSNQRKPISFVVKNLSFIFFFRIGINEIIHFLNLLETLAMMPSCDKIDDKTLFSNAIIFHAIIWKFDDKIIELWTMQRGWLSASFAKNALETFAKTTFSGYCTVVLSKFIERLNLFIRNYLWFKISARKCVFYICIVDKIKIVGVS